MAKEQLCMGVSFHSFSKDRKQICLSQNDEYVKIFDTNGDLDDPKKWTLSCDLQEDQKGQEKSVRAEQPPLHVGFVSGIDWCPESNQIVTCGHDRNAYVWKLIDGKWQPLLVILRIQRAATAVKWAPSGKKFAVASGAKLVPVCHFESTQDWWISKHIKKHKSTVLALDWSPNSKMLVTGGCDFRCRIFSAYVEEVDSEDKAPFDFWDKQNEFGECLAEFDNAKAWVQGVAWCPSNFHVCFVGHGSTLHFADLKSNSVATIFVKDLPYHDVQYVDENTVVCTGFDCNPAVYTKSGDDWKLDRKLDPETDAPKSKSSSAMNKFKNADKKGSDDVDVTPVNTFHKNSVRDVTMFGPRDKRTALTTSGVDGRVITWEL